MRAWRCAYMPFAVTSPFFRECPWRTRSKRLLIASKGEIMCNFCKMGVYTCLLWLFLASAPGGLAPSDFSLSPERGVRRVFSKMGVQTVPASPSQQRRSGWASVVQVLLRWGAPLGRALSRFFFRTPEWELFRGDRDRDRDRDRETDRQM